MASETIPFGDFLAMGSFAYDLSSNLFGIPSPLDLFISAFSGRPTMEATAAIAASYNSYNSPVLKLLALGAADSMNHGIPLSNSSGDPIFGPYYKAALVMENAIRWGSQANWATALDNATLGSALNEAGNPGQAGTATLQAIDAAYSSYIGQGDFSAVTSIANNPPDNGSPAGLLEQGAAREFLTRNPPQTPPGGPPPGPPPLPPAPILDVDGDELTDGTYQLSTYLYYIASALSGLQTPPPTQIDPCCGETIAALNAIGAAISALSGIVGGLKPTIDLTPLTAGLECICTALQPLPSAVLQAAGDQTAALQGIATAISNLKSADVAGVVDQLKQLVTQGDVDQTIFQSLQQLGFLTADDLSALQGIKWSDALTWVEATWLYRELQHEVRNLGLELEDAASFIKNLGGAALDWFVRIANWLLTQQENVLYVPIHAVIESLVSYVKPSGTVSIGNIGVDPDRPLAHLAAIDIWAHIVATLANLVKHESGEGFLKLIERVVEICGLDEIAEVQLGPIVRYGMARVAEQQAKAACRQEVIGASEAYALAARGIIPRGFANALALVNGLPQELEDAEADAAHGGMQARMLLRLVDTGLFTQAEIQDELTFGGMRQVSQARMLRAAPFLATQSQRNALIAEAEKAYAAGFFTDADLSAQIDSAEHTVDRTQLILSRVHITTMIDLAKELESEYSALYAGGLIDEPTYGGLLSGLGLQNWKVNAILAVQEARASVRLVKQEAAALRAVQRATVTVERKAALQNFLAGNTNAAEYAAQLVLTGLTLLQTAAWVDLATLQKGGKQRALYGLMKSAEDAILLKERVTALTDQFKKQLITQDQFTATLAQLGIQPKYINALLAAAATGLGKTALYGVPVETS